MIKISTVDVDKTWSVTEAVKKLEETSSEFIAGVELEDQVVFDKFGKQKEEDFIATYDLSLSTPSGKNMTCKVSFQDFQLFCAFVSYSFLMVWLS